MLRAGYPLSQVTEALCDRWKPGARLLPASDDRSETHVVITDPDRLPEDFRPYIAGIRSETEELGQIVTNFLNFAKPTQLILAQIDMRAIVERAADDIRSEVQARGGGTTIHRLMTTPRTTRS